jgi:hypothetical protein
MDRYSMIVAVMGQLCGTAILISILAFWFQRRRREAVPPAGGMQRVEARLAEIQQAVDSVAVEIERISEGQRFTTRLLSERVAEEPTGVEGARGQRQGIAR